jgi:hypothetical protein
MQRIKAVSIYMETEADVCYYISPKIIHVGIIIPPRYIFAAVELPLLNSVAITP